MTAVEIGAAVATALATMAVAGFAYLRSRGGREERGEKRLWNRLEKVEQRLDDCEKKHDDCEKQRQDGDEKIEALQRVIFRQMGVGDDTGRFLIDEERSSIQSRRPSPPPPKRGDDE